jgi:N-acetylglucosamine kinase-like BadF-type ATPase
VTSVLGVDVGATKSDVLIADETGAVLAFTRAEGANWELIGLSAAYERLAQAVEEALAQARLSSSDLAAAGYGLAGLDWPSDHDRLLPAIRQLGIDGPQILVNDAFAALWAGTREGCGVVVIAGTGSVAAGRNLAGEEARTIGGTYPWGDFGGAIDIVRAAIYAVATAHTGRGRPTALSGRLVEVSGARSVEDLLEGLARKRLRLGANAAPQVIDVAREGDAVAQEIARRAGRELAESALAVAHRLTMESESFDLVLAGGVFRCGYDLLTDTLADKVMASAPKAKLVLLDTPPVIGAVLLGFDSLGMPLRERAYRRLVSEASREQSNFQC